MNKHEARAREFEILRAQLERLPSEILRERLNMKQFAGGASVARQILREREEAGEA
jgi:hypothetical protein